MTNLRTRRQVLRAGAIVAGSSLIAGCHSTALMHTAPPLAVGGESSLRFHAASAGLLFGCAVDVAALRRDPEYARLIRQQCSIIVAENCMKWSNIEPERDRFRFEDADALMAFAEKNRIKMRGHTLVWHEQLPAWLEKEVVPENAQQLMVAHIRKMCSRYSGRIHSWDVVNEAVDPKDGRPDGLRNTPWLQSLGPEYIETAFRAARAADPSALLTYNDWGLEDETVENEDRRRAVLLLIRRLRARNVPVDAVGIQSHLRAGVRGAQYGSGLKRFIAALRDLDLQVFLTELDVDDSRAPAGEAARDAAVVEATSSYLSAALADPSVRAVLSWGISTRHTWLKERYRNPITRGLPFDDTLQPLPMFAAIRDSFSNAVARPQDKGVRPPARTANAPGDVQQPHLPSLR